MDLGICPNNNILQMSDCILIATKVCDDLTVTVVGHCGKDAKSEPEEQDALTCKNHEKGLPL